MIPGEVYEHERCDPCLCGDGGDERYSGARFSPNLITRFGRSRHLCSYFRNATGFTSHALPSRTPSKHLHDNEQLAVISVVLYDAMVCVATSGTFNSWRSRCFCLPHEVSLCREVCRTSESNIKLGSNTSRAIIHLATVAICVSGKRDVQTKQGRTHHCTVQCKRPVSRTNQRCFTSTSGSKGQRNELYGHYAMPRTSHMRGLGHLANGRGHNGL